MPSMTHTEKIVSLIVAVVLVVAIATFGIYMTLTGDDHHDCLVGAFSGDRPVEECYG